MHTATQLRIDMFAATVGPDMHASPELVLPEWSPSDRLGVVVHHPFGALGASLLMQLAIARFYEVRTRGRGKLRQYPEVYLFHTSRRWGNHDAFDIWPERKEIEVADEADAVLGALNTCAITRLVVPDRPPRAEALRFKEPEAALDRIVTALAYSPAGRVADADVTLTSLHPDLELNPKLTLELESVLDEGTVADAQITVEGGGEPLDQLADRRRWRDLVRDRSGEVQPLERERLRRDRASRVAAGPMSETYRRVEVRTALQMLTSSQTT